MSVSSTLGGSEQTVRFELTGRDFFSAYSMTPDGSDIRVIDGDNATLLDFYLEQWDLSSGSAVINVRFPSLTTAPATFYLYYGNSTTGGVSSVPSASDASAAFPNSGWRYNTRNSNLNPTNTAQARAEFEGIADTGGGYGCTNVSTLVGRNNRNTFNGSNGSYGLYAETVFEVTTPGVWSFRAGVDYGRGGALLVDNVELSARWSEDLWWAYNYNNSDVLSGTTTLSSGFHHIEILGFEGCCDGTISVQYLAPGSNSWQELNSANLTTVVRNCPAGIPSTAYVNSDSPAYFGGVTFLDNGQDGSAHDAVKSSGESGVAGTDVLVTVVNTGSAKTVLSDADGRWETCFLDEAGGSAVTVAALVPAEHIAVSESVNSTNSDTALNGLLNFIALANTDYNDIRIGLVERPMFNADNTLSVSAGTVALLPHQYTAATSALVEFQVAQLEHQQPDVYQYSVFQDANCDGALDTPAVPFSTPQSVVVGDVVCMVIQVDGTSSVVESSLLRLLVQATSTLGGIALVDELSNLDVINGAAPELMVLNKTVCNATAGGCDLASGAGFVTNDTGKPDDELIYRISFSSVLSKLRNVSVYDAIPSYTRLKPSSITVVSQPGGLNCIVEHPADQADANFTGTIKWQCDGDVKRTSRVWSLFRSLLIEAY